jgi:hypothetical protein
MKKQKRRSKANNSEKRVRVPSWCGDDTWFIPPLDPRYQSEERQNLLGARLGMMPENFAVSKRQAHPDEAWQRACDQCDALCNDTEVISRLQVICRNRLNPVALEIYSHMLACYMHEARDDVRKYKEQVRADARLADDLAAMAQRLQERQDLDPGLMVLALHEDAIRVLLNYAELVRPIQREIDKLSDAGSSWDEAGDALFLELAILCREMGMRISVDPQANPSGGGDFTRFLRETRLLLQRLHLHPSSERTFLNRAQQLLPIMRKQAQARPLPAGCAPLNFALMQLSRMIPRLPTVSGAPKKLDAEEPVAFGSPVDL